MTDGSSPLISIMTGALASIWTGPFGSGDIPPVVQPAIPPPAPVWSANIKDKEGNDLASIRSKNGGLNLDQYPKNFLNAVIAAEDTRFGDHPGIDLIGLASASLDTVSGDTRGGSGLAQQLAKLRLVGSDRSLERKLDESILAVRLTEGYGEQEILRAYLASAWFGRHSDGAGHAAQAWFGKDWSELSLAENVAIASLLKGASYYDISRQPERNRDRRNAILARMRDLGMIDDHQFTQAKTEELKPVASEGKGWHGNPWQVSMAIRELDAAMADAPVGQMTSRNISATFSPQWQAVLTEAMGTGPDGDVQIAMVAIEIPSGRILATIGGKDFTASGFDRTSALRQPGSSTKPLFYLAAMEFGMTPWDKVRNDPQRVARPGWVPKNYDGKVTGPVPLYKGLESSSNLITLNMAADTGYDRSFDMAELSGAWDQGQIARFPPSVLGATETTLPRLTAGIAGIVNGGQTVPGHSLEGYGPAPAIFASQQSASYVTDMMAGVMKRGTAARSGANLKVPFVGKTGTSQESRDAWFIGMTPSVAIGIWLGKDNDKSMGKDTGGSVAAPYAVKVINLAFEKGLINADGMVPGTYAAVRWPAKPLPSSPAGFDDYVPPRRAPDAVPASSSPEMRAVEAIIDTPSSETTEDTAITEDTPDEPIINSAEDPLSLALSAALGVPVEELGGNSNKKDTVADEAKASAKTGDEAPGRAPAAPADSANAKAPVDSEKPDPKEKPAPKEPDLYFDTNASSSDSYFENIDHNGDLVR